MIIEILQTCLASCSFVDHDVGKVIEAVESGPEADNTIIVLWSDQGYHLGKNTLQKESLWERDLQVPLVFAGPDIAPKQVCDRVVTLYTRRPLRSPEEEAVGGT